MHRSAAGRARRGGGRRPARRRGVLLWRLRRRRVEDRRRRHLLAQRLGRLPRHSRRGRDRGLALRSRRGLCRHGRVVRAQRRVARRRRLPLGRRGPELAALGARAHPTHLARTRPPRGPGHGLGGRARRHLRTQPRPRRLSDDGRRRYLGARAVSLRGGGRLRPVARPLEPAHALRRTLGRAAHALGDAQRRTRLEPLPLERRGRDLAGHHGAPGTADRAAGPHGRVRVAGSRQSGLGRDRGRKGGGRALPLRERRRQLGADLL